MTNSSAIVQRVWNYCNVLRDDGISYGDYLEQFTYLLFIKMDDGVGHGPAEHAAGAYQGIGHATTISGFHGLFDFGIYVRPARLCRQGH